MKLYFYFFNCLVVRVFVESYNRIDLMDMADQYVCEYFIEVVECEDFVSVLFQYFYKFLSFSDLNIENEKQVYSVVIKWFFVNFQYYFKWLDEIFVQVGIEIRLCVEMK